MASQPETEWDAQQRGWMLALAEYRASRCPGCGQNIHESTAQEGTHVWRARARKCWSCDALVAAQQRISQKPESRPDARRWMIEKVR